ncbi:hypothetical protein B0H14DRAFT_3900793 [Mycena olivaceomarginata]|nr:hypothetical protein B0H14DRAFT_3900793 [Mycena olivaceomarginata]
MSDLPLLAQVLVTQHASLCRATTMSFISNADHLTLGEGVYNNVHGNIVQYVHNYGRKRHREEIEDESNSRLSNGASNKRRRRDDHGLKIIRTKHLKLTREIASGPRYFLHAAENNGRAIIVKVFNAGPSVRDQLESTVTLSKGLMHPNVLRIEGISSSTSLIQFIAYESVYWRNTESSLATALKNDLTRSVTLGFKMIAGLSAGINHIGAQDISMRSMDAQNFDVFLDVDDRFLISINPSWIPNTDSSDFRDPQDNKLWDIFNTLCQRVLKSANRVLHNEGIERNPAALDRLRQPSSLLQDCWRPRSTPQKQLHHEVFADQQPPVPPRREYVWRTINRGQKSLAAVATRIALDLEMKMPALNRLTSTDAQNPHRCAGYIREEITLASTTGESAVVAHDAPSPLEVCAVCREVVGRRESFECICGDPNPGSGHTVRCRACKVWSHSDCVGNPQEFICQICKGAKALEDKVSLLEAKLYALEHPEEPTRPMTFERSIQTAGVFTFPDNGPRGQGFPTRSQVPCTTARRVHALSEAVPSVPPVQHPSALSIPAFHLQVTSQYPVQPNYRTDSRLPIRNCQSLKSQDLSHLYITLEIFNSRASDHEYICIGSRQI